MLALGLDDGRVMMVDETTGEEKWANQAHDGQNCQARVAMSPNYGRVVASVGLYEQRFKLWDEASGAVHWVGRRNTQTRLSTPRGLSSLEFSPCGERLVTGAGDGTVSVWDVQAGKEKRRFRAPLQGISSLSFSADGRRLASGSGTICVWDLTSGAFLMGALLQTMATDHHGSVIGVHFSPTNSRLLACAGRDRTTLWDVDSGERIWSIDERAFAVWSPDGASIATGSADECVLHVVDAESGTLRFRFLSNEMVLESQLPQKLVNLFFDQE